MRVYDKDDAERLEAPEWMCDMLKLNPEYVFWGPGEDCMYTKDSGWNSSQEYASWEDFGPWGLDELNEVVNFYFHVGREDTNCPDCTDGYNPETDEISRTFYDFENTGKRWCDKITQDELDALWGENRLGNYREGAEKPSLEEVNAANRHGGGRAINFEYSHDALNRHILIRARAERLGVYGLCPTCQGNMRVFTAPEPDLRLTLWVLHPRKGASRGVEVKNIKREEIPAVLAYLREAANRNAGRFAKVMQG